MEPLLEVRNITKRFGGLIAVDNVSMKIFPGEVVGIVGDNGAGKSTLIKVISGVYHADAGEIYFDSKRIKINNPMEALRIGIETIYQDLALAENLNVYSNIFLGREKLKKFLGSEDLIDKLPNPVKIGLNSMALNLSEKSLTGFVKLKTALINNDFKAATSELKYSKWNTQPNNKVEVISSLFSLAS